MILKVLASIGLTANILLGNVCMMPMAHAEAMPHDQHEEMAMTPVEPMSPAHCEHCVHLSPEKPTQADGGCAGHCLSKASESSQAVSSTTQPLLAGAALPTATSLIVSLAHTDQGFTDSTAPPSATLPTRTIVLLQ